jgi:hypothetical protein
MPERREFPAEIREAVDHMLTATSRIVGERVAEEIARDLLADDDFRRTLHRLVREYVERAIREFTDTRKP